MTDDFVPSRPALFRIWERLSPTVRKERYAEALRRKAVLDEVAQRPTSVSERTAINGLRPATDRSNFRRWKRQYASDGMDGLMDARLPPSPEVPIPPDVRSAILTLRRADPNVAVEVIVGHLAKHHGFKTSETTVKRILRAEGFARSRGPATHRAGTGERHLEFGGMKLLESALVETGYIKALAAGIIAQLDLTQAAAA